MDVIYKALVVGPETDAHDLRTISTKGCSGGSSRRGPVPLPSASLIKHLKAIIIKAAWCCRGVRHVHPEGRIKIGGERTSKRSSEKDACI